MEKLLGSKIVALSAKKRGEAPQQARAGWLDEILLLNANPATPLQAKTTIKAKKTQKKKRK